MGENLPGPVVSLFCSELKDSEDLKKCYLVNVYSFVNERFFIRS